MTLPLRSGCSKTAYIAGPMTGLPSYNFAAFEDAARRLRSQGWHVINPAEEDAAEGFDASRDHPSQGQQRDWFLRDILHILFHSNAIAMLPGYKEHPNSRCHIELAIAKSFGLQVIEMEDYA